MFANLVLRARAQLSKKPTVAGKRMSVKNKNKTQVFVRNGGGKNNAIDIREVVLPTFPQARPVDAAERDQREVIEDAFQRHNRRLYEQKRDELERMHAKMKEACLELEKTDPILFKKAMIKPAGLYFPIERRLPVDTPPVIGWNHDNALSTAVDKK